MTRVLKSKKKKLALTSFYWLRQKTWLGDSWKLTYINQSRFYNFFHVGKLKNIHNFFIKNIFINILAFSTLSHLQAESRAYNKRFYYMLFLLLLQFHAPIKWLTLHKKWSFPLRISSVNVTKFAWNCGFGHVYWRNPEWETSFFKCQVPGIRFDQMSDHKHDIHFYGKLFIKHSHKKREAISASS